MPRPRISWRVREGAELMHSSELLGLIGKVGAFYAQNLADPIVLTAVDEVEGLTTGLSRKIWQKIAILDQILPRQLPG